MSMLQAATARAEWGEPRRAGLRAPGAERGEDGAHASALPMEGGGGGGCGGYGAGRVSVPLPLRLRQGQSFVSSSVLAR